MRITSLDLENVKSYRRLTVDLTPGLNAVCGHNGSGKTTLLESIGFALFDFLPYNQQSFVREGEKTGTIRVRLIARDGREYEVVRRVGSSSTFQVTDVETSTPLAQRRENVLDWIAANALGIDGIADLSSLFKNAVGVPQGLITADFHGTAAQRKAVFDPLLRVAEYRDSWEALRDTVSYLRDLMATTNQQIARLEADTESIPERLQQQAILQRQLLDNEQQLARLVSHRQDLHQKLEALDTLYEELRRLEHDLEIRRQEVQQETARLQEQRQAVESARRAVVEVRESEPGYQRVVEARQHLDDLERKRAERDRLREDLAFANSARQGIFGKIEQLDKQIVEAQQASEDAAALVDAVARQTELERQLGEANARLSSTQSLDRGIAKVKSEIGEVTASLAQREKQLAGARAAAVKAKQLGPVPDRLEETTRRRAALEALEPRAVAVKEEGVTLRTKHDQLKADVDERNRLLAELHTQQKIAASLDDLLQQQQELRDERTRAAMTIEYQNVARAELESHHCPLLDIQCPAVAENAGILNRIPARVDLLTRRTQDLDTQLSRLSSDLEPAQAAAEQIQKLQLRAAQLEGSERQFADILERLHACRTEFQQLQTELDALEAVRKSEADLRAQLVELEAAKRDASRVADLAQTLAEEQTRLQALQRERAELALQRKDLEIVEQRAGDLRRQLADCGDQRAKQQELLGAARNKPALEAELRDHHVKLNEAADRVKAVVGAMHAYGTLDADIESQRQILAANDADYERYMRNSAEAEHLAQRLDALAMTTRSLEVCLQKEAELQRNVEQAQTVYSGEEHTRIRLDSREADQEYASAETTRDHLQGDVKKIADDLAVLRRQEQRLQAEQAELERLQRMTRAVSFIRDTIKSAGPAVTETLLASISQTANDIYAEIMDDHASELRWDRDYEVLVQRGAEVRRFAQLSGGEQMSAALAVRLALLREMSEIDFAFFDEPTQNMDVDRRTNLAEQIRAVRGFEQLIVISHDDTFEHHTDNLIRLSKSNEETALEAR